MNLEQRLQEVEELLKKVVARKKVDTPLENFDVVNKKYVDTGVNARSYGASTTTIPETSDTKVLLTTNSFANGITWDSTNHRFVIQSAGRYLLIGLVTYTGPPADKNYATEIAVNGSVKCASYAQSAKDGLTAGACVSDIQNLSVGDYVELYTYQACGSSQEIYSTSNLTYLSVAKT